MTDPGTRRPHKPEKTNHRFTRNEQSFDPAQERTQIADLEESIELLNGPAEVEYGVDELVVVCLLRNGRPYIGSFVDHYLNLLGVKHLFFLDNGSTDGTVEALQGYENVTVMRSHLPFKHYQMIMKRYLMEHFGRERWVLYADIDELFDYPFSDMVGLEAFLGYLSSRSYTAVVGQMLDMFSEEPVRDQKLEGDEPLGERHRFYDLSNINTASYHSLPIASGSQNLLADEGIELFRDGIQNKVFGGRTPLTKHPLVFIDDETRPMDGSSHSVSGAHIADVTCVIFHYKFLDSLYEHLRRAAEEENYMKDSSKHKRHLEIMEQDSSFPVKQETSEELESTNELVVKGFLNVSGGYMDLVEEEAGKDAVRSERYRNPARNLLDAQETIRLRNQKIRGLEQHVKELEEFRRIAVRRGNKNKALEQENRRLRSQDWELRSQIQSLQQQLQQVRASRAWILLDTLNRLKIRLLGR